jgi:hypothetical protein
VPHILWVVAALVFSTSFGVFNFILSISQGSPDLNDPKKITKSHKHSGCVVCIWVAAVFGSCIDLCYQLRFFTRTIISSATTKRNYKEHYTIIAAVVDKYTHTPHYM